MLKYEVPYRKWATKMALNVQVILSENKLIGEKIVTPRLVNKQYSAGSRVFN